LYKIRDRSLSHQCASMNNQKDRKKEDRITYVIR